MLAQAISRTSDFSQASAMTDVDEALKSAIQAQVAAFLAGEELPQEHGNEGEAMEEAAAPSLKSLHTCPVCREQCGSLKHLRHHLKNALDDAHRDGCSRLPTNQQRILQGGSFECSCGAVFSKQKKLRRHLSTYPCHSYVEGNCYNFRVNVLSLMTR